MRYLVLDSWDSSLVPVPISVLQRSPHRTRTHTRPRPAFARPLPCPLGLSCHACSLEIAPTHPILFPEPNHHHLAALHSPYD